MIGYIQSLDSIIIHTVQSVGPSWYGAAWLLSYIIGSLVWLGPTAVVALVCIGKKRVALETLFIFAVSSASIFLIKYIINAPRPYLIDPTVIPYVTALDSGMPSAHAFLSIIIFGWLLLRHPKSTILTIGSVSIIFLIGLSRIYLGVHYPSQVIIGWVLGLFFLWFFWWLDKVYFRPRSSYVKKGK